ncbi:hypothetical protein CC2G_003781 [Coprinopsis cinerea AmutBmut pab1-1]|nr:hypothetical protein CC2G_003781 [Coprinopsis cinerea AmutBmut pab1-1]
MSTEVIDFSAQSKRNISILAWYTDVLHEVKPVTSGHRVALSFNLIHTTPSIPRPQFKSASPIPLDEWLAKLRSVLERWVKHGCPIKKVSRRLPPSQYTIRKQYLTKLTPQFYAYVLKHRYSLRDLNKGRACLKGEDAHKFSLLSLLAKELGFKLALARLEIGISGVADDLERYEEMVESKRWERRWAWEEKMKKEMKERKKRGEKVEKIDPDDFDSADEEDERNWKSEPFNLINTYETKYNLRKVVKDSGKPFIKKSSSEVKIPLDGENFNIIPKDPVYLGEDPDQRQYRPSGYLGNDPGDLTFWYNNAVVIIYHERDEEKLVPYFKGDDWDHDLEYPH